MRASRTIATKEHAMMPIRSVTSLGWVVAVACLATVAQADQTPGPWGHTEERWEQVDVSLGFGFRSITLNVIIGSVDIPVHTIGSGLWNDPGNWNDLIVYYSRSKTLFDLVTDPGGTEFVEVDLETGEATVPFSDFMDMGPTERPISIPIGVDIPNVGEVTLELGTYAHYEVTVRPGHTVRLNQNAKLETLAIAGGTLELQDGYSLIISRGSVDNQGVIRKAAGTGSFSFPREIINEGTVSSAAGTLYLPSVTNLGTLCSEPGGTLSLPPGPLGGTIYSEGTIHLRGTEVLTPLRGPGTFRVVGYGDRTTFPGIDVRDATVDIGGIYHLDAWGTWTDVTANLTGAMTSDGARLWIPADEELVLTGAGTIALSHHGAEVQTRGGTARVINGPDHTIEGWGQLNCTLLNEGTITAKGADKRLSMGGATNPGTLRAEPDSTLRISGRVDGGTIIADGTVELYGATIVTGVPMTGAGVFQANSREGAPTLEGVPVQDTTIRIDDDDRLYAWGTWTGVTTELTGPVHFARPRLWIPADRELVLAGPGKLTLSHHDAQVQTQGGTARLVNGPGHTIEGWGQLNCTLLNQGTITAKGTDKRLSMVGATNLGTLRAEPGSTLRISGRVDGGTIIADGTLELYGATIATDVPMTGAGVFQANSREGNPTLEGVPVEDTTVRIEEDDHLYAWGTWTGVTTELTGPAHFARPRLWVPADQELVLAGPGKLTLSHHDAQVQTQGGTARLVNGPGHTIEGWGQLNCALLNEGTVDARASGKALIVSGGATNNGLMAARGGVLKIGAAVDGSGGWLADGGTIDVGAVSVSTSGPIQLINGGGLTLNGTTMTTERLTMDATSWISVASSLSVDQQVTFAMTDESAWNWSTNAVLEMSGGRGALAGHWGDWVALEVGGADLGDSLDGLAGNFHLEDLVLSDGAHVFLTDTLDNGNRGDAQFGLREALYVRNLTLGEGAVLNANNLPLYYRGLSGPGQVVNAQVPEPGTLVLLVLGMAIVSVRTRLVHS